MRLVKGEESVEKKGMETQGLGRRVERVLSEPSVQRALGRPPLLSSSSSHRKRDLHLLDLARVLLRFPRVEFAVDTTHVTRDRAAR